jgi:hypothetical protein
MKRDNERELWGNGTLTVAARLASAVGVPMLGTLMLWLGSQVWSDVRGLRDDKVELARSLSAINQRLDDHHRWNTQQDSRIDKAIERRSPAN